MPWTNDNDDTKALTGAHPEFPLSTDNNFNVLGPKHNDLKSFFNGTFIESFDALVTSDGATITMSLEKTGGGDLTLNFSDEQTTFDCTPAATLSLTAGTDTDPQRSFVYILQSNKVLVENLTGWPDAEHIRVGWFHLPSASLANTGSAGNNFAYGNQNINDHPSDSVTNQGHLTHITARSRRMGGLWNSGTEGVATQDGNDLWVSIAAGVVSQMHMHTFDALNSDTDLAGDPILVPNDPDANFAIINSLNEITKDSTGALIANNKYLKFVLWGVANKTGAVSLMMINLPGGTYNTQSGADVDVEGFANFSMPDENTIDSSTGFLVADFICQRTATSMDIKATVDLRGQIPGNATGAGTGGGDVTSATTLTDNAIVRGDGGAKGVQTSTATISDAGALDVAGQLSTSAGGAISSAGSLSTVTTVTVGTSLLVNTTSFLQGNVTIGDGTDGSDFSLTFDGNAFDGVLTWMEDEDYFEFSDDVLLATNEKMMFRATGNFLHSSDTNDLQLEAVADINLVAPTTIRIGLTTTTTRIGKLGGDIELGDNTGAVKAFFGQPDEWTLGKSSFEFKEVWSTSFFLTTRQTYTPTNVTTDRTYDANATTTAELADVLGTLIADLQTGGLIQ